MRLSLQRFRRRESRLESRVRDLLWDWDPLGDDDPFNPHLPASEYDWLIEPILVRLRAGQVDDLEAFLNAAVRERYGVHGDEEKLRQLVKGLVDLSGEAGTAREAAG